MKFWPGSLVCLMTVSIKFHREAADPSDDCRLGESGQRMPRPPIAEGLKIPVFGPSACGGISPFLYSRCSLVSFMALCNKSIGFVAFTYWSFALRIKCIIAFITSELGLVTVFSSQTRTLMLRISLQGEAETGVSCKVSGKSLEPELIKRGNLFRLVCAIHLFQVGCDLANWGLETWRSSISRWQE